MSSITFDREEAHLRGQIPLNKIKELVESLSPDSVTQIDFSCNGYCTDAVLRTIARSAKAPFTQLTDVNLQGCTLLTDVGIKWLADFIKHSRVSMVLLDGCLKLTENSLGLLVDAVSESSTILMRSTSMRYIQSIPVKSLQVHASPIISGSPGYSKLNQRKQGHVIIVPHSRVEHSVSKFIKSKAIANRELAHYETDVKVKDWNVSLTEMSLDNPLFDVIVHENPVQVVIPFDASAGLKEIQMHVMDTVSRVICKEKVYGKFPIQSVAPLLPETGKSLPFMDVNNLVNQIMTKDNLLTNFSKGGVIGCYYSRQMLTRSNPYFEVQCVSSTSEVENKKANILIGCLYDVHFTTKVPMDAKVKLEGEAESFETEAGEIYGFGMEGTWESEYCPSTDMKFYATKNGERYIGNLLNKNSPKTNHYPLVACIGDGCQTKIKFLQMNFPPENLVKNWEKEKRTVAKGFTQDCVVDNDGIISFLGTGTNNIGSFISLRNVIEDEHDTCTFRIEDLGEGNKDSIAFGIVPYNFDTNSPHSFDFISTSNRYSFLYKNGTGKVTYNGTMTDKLFTLDKGDEITMYMKFIKDVPGFAKVEIYKNRKQVAELEYEYKDSDGLARVHFMAKISSKNAKVKVVNFRPHYRAPALIPEKITVGRIHIMKVMDDGTLTSEYPLTKQVMHGMFLAKTPLNSEMMSFQVKILTLDASKVENEIWVGLGHSYVSMDDHLGSTVGAVAYSSSGKLFLNGTAIEKYKSEDIKFRVYDVVGCGVEVVKGTKSLLFNEDKSIKSQQKVVVYFTKNGKRVCETEMEHVWDGMYPCVTMSKPDLTARVLNFYPENIAVRNTLEKEKLQKKAEIAENEKKVEQEKNLTPFTGCEFLVLGLGGDDSDVISKLQLLQQQVSLKDDFPAQTQIAKYVQELEKNLGDLDLQKQENYSQLCGILDNMNNIRKENNRMHFMAADLRNGKGHDRILQQIEQTLEAHLNLQKPRFDLPDETFEVMEKVSTRLKTAKMMKVIASDFGIENMCNDIFLEIIRHMQEQGRLVLADLGFSQVVIDVPYALQVISETEKLSDKTMGNADNSVLAISKTSHIWTEEKFYSAFKSLSKQWDLLKMFLNDYIGLLKIPCFRTKPDDPKFVFTTLSSLSTPTMSLTEYWSKEEETPNFVVTHCTYSFPHSLPDHILSLMLCHMTKYGRILLLTPDGAAFQMGAVQTVIIRHEGHMEKGVISIESKCYFPKKMADPVFELTETNVKEYTWNIFCIYTDIVDSVLKRQNLVPLISRKVPPGLVNMSVGCKHNWKAFDFEHIQSVCTLCGQCCDKGMDCPWNGIVGSYMRECGCKTSVVGCADCGICQSCAKEMWEVRSRLRPWPSMSSHLVQDNLLIPMDPLAFNEIEFIHLQGKPPNLCLKEVYDGTLIYVFPGQALVGATEKKRERKVANVDVNNSDSYEYSSIVKDHITIRLLDPQNTISTLNAEMKLSEGVQESRVVYHASLSRELRVSHETGLVCYDSRSPCVPLAKLVGPKPFSKTFSSFSLKVISRGQRGRIVIGVCPNTYPPSSEPGWQRFSVGYNGEDGGISNENSRLEPSTNEKWEVGDIIKCELLTEQRKLTFYKNDEEVFTKTVTFPQGGYFPCIGMHSNGECLKLLEKEPWERTDEVNIKPLAFDTHRYGNLFISPARTLYMKKIPSEISGWVILHNPWKGKIAYKVTEVYDPRTDSVDHVGILTSGDNISITVILKKGTKPPSELIVKWMALEKSKDYTIEFVTEQFRSVHEDRIYHHRINVTTKRYLPGRLKALKRVANINEPPSNNVMVLEVLKNRSLVDRYWIKVGDYRLDLPKTTGNYLIHYPKCPTYLYPPSIQKGLKVVVKQRNEFVEAAVTEMHKHGVYSLEYTPPGKQEKVTLCFEPGHVGINDLEWEDDKNIFLFKPDNNMPLLNKTYLPAPPYMTTEGSEKALMSLDPDWKTNALISFSRCSQVVTRITVQEQMIAYQSRTLKNWLKGFGYNGFVDAAFTFLPSSLDIKMLTFPVANNMFDDIAVHRLCLFADQRFHLQPTHNLNLRIPIHFVDIPAEIPTKPIPVNLTYGCLYTGWIYIALLAHKIMLPSYSQIFKERLGNYTREQIESLLYYLIQPYASLCSLYAAQVGGLPNQENPSNGTDKIEEILQNKGVGSVVKFNGKPSSDTHKLVKHGKMLSCKAHQLSISGNASVYSKDLQMNYDYFEPYNELVNAFCWDLPLLPSLPKDFFLKFCNLQCFFLHGSELKDSKEFPSELSNCKRLETVVLAAIGISKLPKDLIRGPALKTLTCKEMPVKSLAFVWPAESQLTKLVLSSLLITEVPPEICRLGELTELNLDYNPITSLPDQLQNLPKLKILSMKGIPWITFQGTKTQMTLGQYLKWHQENKCVAQNIPEEGIQKFFRKFDKNKNNELDESEISYMNLHMFFKIPRLRNKKSNEYGGIPEVIFKMTSLQELYLNFQGITIVPAQLSHLQNLQVLSLNNCPLLESISGSVGLIPNIKVIRLTSCPSLRTPPNEIVSRGFESIQSYLKRLAGGVKECYRTKLMFVGLGGAGKTSLLQALMSNSNKTRVTDQPQMTDGIQIKPWEMKDVSGLSVTFSTWDFAGQTVYYNTHQFFLSNRAVYVLLWNMRMGFEHAGLDFWLSSIVCHAPETPILVVGTQSDQVPKVDIPEKELKQRYPQISSFHYVSSVKGYGIEALKEQLFEVTLQQQYMGENIPKVWFNLEKKILAERYSNSILKWETIKDFAMDQGIYDDKDVNLAVKFLHDLGTVQYFDNDFLRDRIVINPQWIVNVMACVVSVKQSPIQENLGRFMHEHFKSIWKDYSEDLHIWLLRLTEEFDLTFPLPKDPINIVPCLLPQEEPSELSWPDLNSGQNVRENKMVYKFAYLPVGLFNRVQVRLFQFSDGKLIWKKGSLLTKNRHLALIRQTTDSELVVLVQGPRPENVLLLIHEVFESLIEESFHGVKYDFFIPCPDCITKEGTKEPCLFKAELIRRAGNLKAPFLQCTKYFHTVSMGQLLELMPEDKDTDFDIHLQHSISALQSINKAMSTDVAILYCKADVSGYDKKNRVDPYSIIKDLEEAGLSCWFSKMEEEVKVEDIMVAIKNCKVVVAVMSDQFEKDMLCNNMFLYALEKLKKPLHIAVIGESMKWQKSDLGMKIEQPHMAMVEVWCRYQTEIEDFIELTTETVNDIKRGLAEHPACFISYCWANSRQAVQLGTKAKPGSLGYGDPRDIKDFLAKKGIKCWIDHEQMGKYGPYHDIAVGLQNCKVIVAFVSDEYIKSEACMMELRFGVCTMNLPLVVVVVGTGREWKQSEVGLLMGKSSCGVSKVYMQKDNPEGFEAILRYVQNSLSKPNEGNFDQTVKKEKEKSKKSSTEDSHFLYREEHELIQRKFMRHINTMINKTDLQPLPKLFVFDFLEGKRKEESDEPKPIADDNPQVRMLRSKTATKSQIKMKPISDINNGDWEEEELCIKVLCEHEEGWHLMGSPLRLKSQTKEEIHNVLTLAAPFLARIYAILRQSSLGLNCINSKKGNNFQNWLEDKRDSRENDGNVAAAFLIAYIELIKYIQDHSDLGKFTSQLDRCHLPSGKIYWLCSDHQKGNRITKLSTDDVSVGGGGKNTLFREDMLFKEYLEEHPEYRKVKTMKKGKTITQHPEYRGVKTTKKDKTVTQPYQHSNNRPSSSRSDNKVENNKNAEIESIENGKEKETSPQPTPKPAPRDENEVVNSKEKKEDIIGITEEIRKKEITDDAKSEKSTPEPMQRDENEVAKSKEKKEDIIGITEEIQKNKITDERVISGKPTSEPRPIDKNEVVKSKEKKEDIIGITKEIAEERAKSGKQNSKSNVCTVQ